MARTLDDAFEHGDHVRVPVSSVRAALPKQLERFRLRVPRIQWRASEQHLYWLWASRSPSAWRRQAVRGAGCGTAVALSDGDLRPYAGVRADWA